MKRVLFLFCLFAVLVGWLDSVAFPLPLAPSHLEAQVISPTHIRLTWWDNSIDEDGFILDRKTPDTDWSRIAVLPPDVNVYNDEELTPGGIYYYRVRAYKENYYTEYCELPYPVKTIGYPVPPSSLEGRALSSSEIELKWKDESDNELGFIVERKIGKNWEEVSVLPPDTESYIDVGLSENTKYTYRVLAFNDAGRSSSEEIEVKTESSQGELYLSAGCSMGEGDIRIMVFTPVFIFLYSLIRKGRT